MKHTPSLAWCVFVIMALPTPTASPLRCASPTSALVEGFPSVAQRLAVYLILGDEYKDGQCVASSLETKC